MDKLVNKLRVAGTEIGRNNSFGVVYRNKATDKWMLLKRKIDGTGNIKRELTTDKYNISEHFIILDINRDFKYSIYVKDLDIDLVRGYNQVFIQYFDGYGTIVGSELPFDTKVIMLETDKQLLLLNYQGKVLDITSYKVHIDSLGIGGIDIVYDKENNRYNFILKRLIKRDENKHLGLFLTLDSEFTKPKFIQ